MATTSWSGANDGFWNATSSWSPNIPVNNDDAVIAATGGSYTAFLTDSTATLDSLTINSANATLLLESSTAVLFVTGNGSGATNQLAVDAGTVDMAGGEIQAPGGITLGSGGVLEGFGTVVGAPSGSGTVLASGGDLSLQSAIGASTDVNFTIGDTANSILEVGAPLGAGNTFTFQKFADVTQSFAYDSASPITENIVGLNVSSDPTPTPTNFVDFRGDSGLIVEGSNEGSGTAGTVTLSDGSTLTLSGITNSPGTWFVDTVSDGGSGTEVFLSAVCYAAGTRILTVTGERAIESLLQGDIVLTLSDGELKAQPVKWVGRRRIDLTAHPRPETVAPIRIHRGAFADNTPHTDLLVSPDHAIFADGKLICARQLVNGTTIRQELDWTAVDYYHVELDQHAILMAEGLPAESYIDTGNSGFFANSGQPMELHPDLTDESGYLTREAGSCAPFIWDEASVRPVWQRLADRAAAIGRPVPQRATTTDAGLRLRTKLTGRRTIEPIYSDSNLVIFVLPSRSPEVRLVSRAQSPTEARPWLEDRRHLGVRVKRIVLRGADDLREIPVDHPDLTRGWWAVERDGQVMSRWTDGEAVLPLPAMRGTVMLEIYLAGSMTYVVDDVPAGGTERRAAA
jgi:hypothetical protein